MSSAASRIRNAGITTAATVLWASVFLLLSEAVAVLGLLSGMVAIGVQSRRRTGR